MEGSRGWIVDTAAHTKHQNMGRQKTRLGELSPNTSVYRSRLLWRVFAQVRQTSLTHMWLMRSGRHHRTCHLQLLEMRSGQNNRWVGNELATHSLHYRAHDAALPRRLVLCGNHNPHNYKIKGSSKREKNHGQKHRGQNRQVVKVTFRLQNAERRILGVKGE